MWRTCFRSLAILSLASLPSTAAAETIKGVLALNAPGDARPAKKLDASGVVVWLEPATPAGQAAVAPKPSAVHQRNFAFLPHVTAVQVGTAVDFPNDDPIFHNVFSNFDGQVFDLHLYAPQTARRVVFRRPGIVPYRRRGPCRSTVVARLKKRKAIRSSNTMKEFPVRSPAEKRRFSCSARRAGGSCSRS